MRDGIGFMGLSKQRVELQTALSCTKSTLSMCPLSEFCQGNPAVTEMSVAAELAAVAARNV